MGNLVDPSAMPGFHELMQHLAEAIADSGDWHTFSVDLKHEDGAALIADVSLVAVAAKPINEGGMYIADNVHLLTYPTKSDVGGL